MQKVVRYMCQLEKFHKFNITGSDVMLTSWLHQNPSSWYQHTCRFLVKTHEKCRDKRIPKEIKKPKVTYWNPAIPHDSLFLNQIPTAVDCNVSQYNFNKNT